MPSTDATFPGLAFCVFYADIVKSLNARGLDASVETYGDATALFEEGERNANAASFLVDAADAA